MVHCLSCDILSGQVTEPGGMVYEDAFWHVGAAVGPSVWPGFLVIKLKRHCEHLAELTPEEAAALGPVVRLTCQALMEVLQPAKVYVCSFGEGVQHVHLWALPRPASMRPGMHWALFNLDLRLALTRGLGIRKWRMKEDQVADLAEELRSSFARQMAREAVQ